MDSTLDTDDAVLEFLRSWADAPEIETHAARVFLRGHTALKIKRPVHYDFLDFRKLSDRRRVLDRELEINKPNAPMLYEDVVAITRSADGSVELNGSGEVLDWALKMARFPKDHELSEIARRGALDLQMAEALGDMVHELHAKAPVSACDGSKLIAEILSEFGREFQTLHEKGVELDVSSLLEVLRAELLCLSELLQDRSRAGFVKRCHGDLHMRNIVFLDAKPVAFDALEFSERMGTCDVLYDLAFLLMDLDVSGHKQAANSVLNAYISAENDKAALKGLSALSLFKSVRAVVRAMVAAEQYALHWDASKLEEAKTYLAYARETVEPSTGALYAIGGLSGTGKTTIARGLRADLGGKHGAVHIRSDVERKRLAGVPLLTKLPADHYDCASSAATYDEIRARASVCLHAGMSVLLDAVFADPEERERIAEMSGEFGVPFRPVWLDVSQGERCHRVADRRNDASDADVAVVVAQSKKDCGHISWPVVQADGPYAETLEHARTALSGETDDTFSEDPKDY
ncbi:MAG: AAA family ATPase [Pseudomonadota bacterium]